MHSFGFTMKVVPRIIVLRLAVVVALGLSAAEVVLQLFVEERVYSKSARIGPSPRFRMWSSPHFRVDDEGAVRYLPGESVRLVAGHYNRIDYDLTYQTNDLGLIDHENYQDSSAVVGRRIAIVGDSFAAGIHGGEPWIPELRDKLRAAGQDVELYNLGLSGASFLHCEKLLLSVATELSFTEIVIVGISDDFTRAFWTPHAERDGLWFVPEGSSAATVSGERPVARIIRGNETAEELGRLVAEWNAEDQALADERGLLERSALLQLSRKVARRLTGGAGSRAEHISANFEALARIRSAFPEIDVSFVHVPSRDEARVDAYDMEIEEQLAALGIKYFRALRETSWTGEHYFQNDRHPNGPGYVVLADYVARVLGLFEQVR